MTGPGDGNGRLPAGAGTGAPTGCDALSYRAVSAVAALGLTDPAQICARLYTFNTVPLGPGARRRLPDTVGLAGLVTDNGWRPGLPIGSTPGWLAFYCGRPEAQPPRVEFTHKVYVSPLPGLIDEVLPVVLRAGARAGLLRGKVGAGPAGLLRPDKLVLYATDAGQVADVAKLLRRELTAVAAQGVPFTAALTDDALVSWGGDPPSEKRESWRLFVSRRLGDLLGEGLSADEAIAALQHRDGVPPSFAPPWLEAPDDTWRTAA